MRPPTVLTLQKLERAYGIDGDVELRGFLRRYPVRTDAELADLIDLDGRLRSGLGKRSELARYMDAVPRLDASPVALDAAIEASLRSMRSFDGCSDEQAVRQLATTYPALREMIEDAAALSRGLWTSSWARDQFNVQPPRDLPCEFGPPLADRPGQRFELRESLGEGVAGRVYRAVDKRLSDASHDAIVAIKVLFPDEGASEERFFTEATRARRVMHANVVRVLDRGIDDASGEAYIVYDFVEGPTLLEWWDDGRPREQVVEMVAKIASGLQAAHREGLVHRDLHPANILVDGEGEPRICDFGLAHDTEDAQADDGSERPQGNLAFMAPEQFRMEEGAPTAASDIYSIGGLLFFMLLGKPPHGTSPEEVAAAFAAEIPTPAVDALADHDLELIVTRALAPDPADRHHSSAELASDLRAWLRHEPIAWTQPSVARRTGLLVRRRPLATVLVACAGIALVSAIVVGLYTYDVVIVRKRATEQHFQTLMNEARGIRSETHAAGMLAILQSLQTFDDRADLGRQISPDAVASGRIEVIDSLVETWRKSEDVSIRLLFWETALAHLMMASTDEHPEAYDILERNISDWRGMTRDDAWLAELETLRDVGVVKKAWFTASRDEVIGPEQRAELLAAVGRIERALTDDSDFTGLGVGLRDLAWRVMRNTRKPTLAPLMAEE
ncbi:MAG: serine/threonine-protein kinase [Planctomycetota bacterium]